MKAVWKAISTSYLIQHTGGFIALMKPLSFALIFYPLKVLKESLSSDLLKDFLG